MSSIPYWRNIHKSLTVNFHTLTVESVTVIIDAIRNELVAGLMYFNKPYTQEGFLKWKKTMNDNHDLVSLVERLCTVTNLDCTLGYSVLCNYLMFEYYGKVSELVTASKLMVYVDTLLAKFWQFYTTERMFCLKVFRLILQNYKRTDHENYAPMRKFMEWHPLPELTASVLAQFRYLVEELHHTTALHCPTLKDWADRNAMEMMEVLSLLMICFHKKGTTVSELMDLVQLYKDHGFGSRPPGLPEASHYIEQERLEMVKFMEYGTFIVAMETFWANHSWMDKLEELKLMFGSFTGIACSDPIILLCWSILLTNLPPNVLKEKMRDDEHAVMFDDGFESDVMTHLLTVCKLPYMNGSMEVIVKCAIYKMLEEVGTRLANIFVLFEKQNFTELLMNLMSVESICDDLFEKQGSCFQVIAFTLNLFPYDYTSFALINKAFLKHERYKTQILQDLNKIEIYCEVTSPTEDARAILRSNLHVTNHIEIPEGAAANIVNLPSNVFICQFSGAFSYTYQLYISHQVGLTADTCKESTYDKGVFRVCARQTIVAMEFLVEYLAADKRLYNDQSFIHIVTTANYMLSKVIVGDYPDVDLITSCFMLSVATMPKLHVSTLHMLTSSFFLPLVPIHLQHAEGLFQVNALNSACIFQLINQEKSNATYRVLNMYIDFVMTSLQNQYDIQRSLLPGIVYLFLHVFPQHLSWEYRDAADKYTISLKIITILFNILQQPGLGIAKDSLVYNFCIAILFDCDAFIKVFMVIVRSANSYLEMVLCRESDWKSSRTGDLHRAIRYCLCLMLGMFGKKDYAELKESNFWKNLFRPVTTHACAVKYIGDYINHKCDANLAKTACRLLTKICADPEIPILSSVEMDFYQVQNMFMEKLRDPLEDFEMQVLLIKMITTCVKSQHGMTSAFFTTSSTHSANCTVVEYLNDNLKTIHACSDYLRSPVHSAILDLFHTIWSEKKRRLVRDINYKIFWNAMVNPLKKDYKLDHKSYTQILEILAVQMVQIELHADLKPELISLLTESNFITSFPQYLSSVLLQRPEDDAGVHMLFAFSKFWIAFIKSHNELLNDEMRRQLAEAVIENLNVGLLNPVDTRISFSFLQLYLYIITQWDKQAYIKTHFSSVVVLFKRVQLVYHFFDAACREFIITVAINVVEQMGDLMETNQEVEVFLDAVRALLEKEYDCVRLNTTNDDVLYKDHICWLLIVIFGGKLIQHPTYNRWFFFTRFLEKVFHTIPFYMSHTQTMDIAKISLVFLVKYLHTDMYKDYIYLNYSNFYGSFRIPKQLFDCTPLKTLNKDITVYEEFWVTYTALINLNLVLIDKLGYFMYTPILEFINLCRDEIYEIIKLPQITVHESALRLVSRCLRLCNFLLKWGRHYSTNVFEPLLMGYHKMLGNCLNNCITIILRPKVIRVYEHCSSGRLNIVEDVPVSFLVVTMNKIIEIITSACMGLLEISPKMVDDLERTITCGYEFNIDYEFFIPDPISNNDQHLSFGGVLCLLHSLCKTSMKILLNKGEEQSGTISTITFTLETPDSTKPKWPRKYMTFVYLDYNRTSGVQDKFNSIQRFANSEIYSLAAPWMSQMNKQIVMSALEILNTLLASQIRKALNELSSNPMQLQLLKRDLCSELQFFHEFVRKKLIDPHKYIIDGNSIMKNKTYSETTDDSSEYLLMLSHWYMVICQLTP